MKYIVSIILLAIVGVFFIVGAQLIAIGLVVPFFDIPLMDFLQVLQNPTEEEYRTPILLVQGLSALGGFLGAGLFFALIYKKSFGNVLSKSSDAEEEKLIELKSSSSLIFLVVIALAIVAFPAVWVIGALNGSLELPEALSELEKWMRASEEQLGQLTLFMTDFQNPLQIFLGFVVIAVIAGVAEEVFFRGVMQPLFQNLFKGNHHLAIWTTAIIFSAIHLQFYGFLPRMLLGAMFGYLYYYTKNINVPIWAHILNNGLTLVLVLLVDKDKKEMLNAPQIESDAMLMMSVFGLMSLMICIALLRFIKNKTEALTEKEINNIN